MFAACPGPSWPAAPPCGLPARGRECRAGRSRVQMQIWGLGAVRDLVVTAGGLGFLAQLLLSQLPPRRLPMRQLKGAIRSAGQQMSDEAKSVRVVERPEKAIIKAFVDSPGPFPKTSPSFLVVSGAQGTGKTTMLESLFAEYHDDGRWVLPVSPRNRPGRQTGSHGCSAAGIANMEPAAVPAKFPVGPNPAEDPEREVQSRKWWPPHRVPAAVHQKPGRPFHR